MYIDAFVIGAVVAELQALAGGRIQQVVIPSADSVGFEVYQAGVRHQLLLSAHPTHARLHLVPDKLTRGPGADSPLLLLLRKYVRGGRIDRIECPPQERVVTFSITKMPRTRNQAEDDDPDDQPVLEPVHSELVVEILGRSANIVLLDDDGLVLESVRHFTPGRSQRPIIPRSVYEAPPRQDKADPRAAEAAQIARLHGDTLAQALVAMFRGVSPQTGREVAFRVAGAADAPLEGAIDAAAVAATLRSLASGEENRPSLARDADGAPIAVAPFWLRQHANVEEQPTINAAMAAAFADVDRVAAHAKTRAALLGQVEELRRRAQTKVDQLRTQLARAEQLERLRWEGEMIFAYLHTLRPGQEELLLDTGVIALDPKLTGVENAQRRFREYDKAKGAQEDVPRLLSQAEAQAAFLRETADLLALADSFETIEQFERELTEGGWLKARASKPKGRSVPRRGPLRVVSPDGWTIYVGRSAAENDDVTFSVGQPNDYWFHVRQRTGGHVIVRMQGDELPPATLERAAQLAAYYSSARHDGVAEVDLARRRNVRRVKDGPPGLVYYEAEQTVRVVPMS